MIKILTGDDGEWLKCNEHISKFITEMVSPRKKAQVTAQNQYHQGADSKQNWDFVHEIILEKWTF